VSNELYSGFGLNKRAIGLKYVPRRASVSPKQSIDIAAYIRHVGGIYFILQAFYYTVLQYK
jgi:hypothetical protein